MGGNGQLQTYYDPQISPQTFGVNNTSFETKTSTVLIFETTVKSQSHIFSNHLHPKSTRYFFSEIDQLHWVPITMGIVHTIYLDNKVHPRLIWNVFCWDTQQLWPGATPRRFGWKAAYRTMCFFTKRCLGRRSSRANMPCDIGFGGRSNYRDNVFPYTLSTAWQ